MGKKRKGFMKRVVMMVLVFCMVVGGVPPLTRPMEVKAAGVSLADLQKKFPQGKYWNHRTQADHRYLMYSPYTHYGSCNNPDGYTDFPCNQHGIDCREEGKYDCNWFSGIQCNGFVRKLSSLVYGQQYYQWGKTTIQNAKPGDVIMLYGGAHWAMIIGRTGTKLTYGECNRGNTCMITWTYAEDLANRSDYAIYSAPWELPTTPTPPQGSVMPTDPNPNARTLSNGDYLIMSALEGDRYNPGSRCLSTEGDNGNNVELGVKEEIPTPIFTVTWLGNGFYSIRNKSSGKYLDVADADKKRGANVQQHPLGPYEADGTDNPAQQWRINETDDGKGGYTLQARCSSYFLDVYDGCTNLGTNIRVWEGNNEMAERWFFVPWGGGSSARPISEITEDVEYQLVPQIAQDKVLSVQGNGVTNGTNIALGSNKGNAGHTFKVKWLGEGYYEIVNKNSNLAMDVSEGASKKMTNVQLWERLNENNKKWLIKSCGDGYYNIISKCNGLYLEVFGNLTADGSNIVVYTGNGGDNQKWKLVPYTRAVESVTLDRTNITLKVGEQYTLWTTISPTDAANKTLTWESSNPSVAAIGLYQAVQSNVVTAKAQGTATITVKSANGKTAVCQVTVQDPHTHVYGSVWKYNGSNHYKECTCGAKSEEATHAFVQNSDESKHWKECICGAKTGEAAHEFVRKSDESKHWKECSCGARTGEAEHTFAWIVDTPATTDSTGLKHEECSTCGSKRSEDTVINQIPSKHNTHEYGSGWQSDQNNHWKECGCGEKSEIAAHEFEWVIDRAATQTAEGIKHEECRACGYKRSEGTVIAKLQTPEHTHEYESVWQSDGSDHWKACGCGEKSEEGAHAFTWVVDQAATTESTGLEHEECVVCGYSRKAGTVIEKLPAPHTHVYGDDWQSDGENHWKECGCGVRTEEAEHTFAWIVDTAATQTAEGVKHEECRACGYKRSEGTVIAKLQTSSSGGNNNDGSQNNSSENNPGTPETNTNNADAAPSPIIPIPVVPVPAEQAQKPNRQAEAAGTPAQEDGKPFIKGADGKIGWAAILTETGKAQNGMFVNVSMGKAAVVPGNIFDSVKGREVILSFDMGQGVLWSVNGKSVTAEKVGDVNLNVKTGVNTIPAELVNNVAGKNYSTQISIVHDGEFGFTAVLNIDIGKKNKGLTASLYYYNQNEKELEFVTKETVTENGMASFALSHASEYAIVVEAEEEVKKAESTEPEKPAIPNQTTETVAVIEESSETEKKGNKAWLVLAGVIVLVGAGMTAVQAWKKKKEQE